MAPLSISTGLPHRVMKDDIYENYFIPKGTEIIANIWYLCIRFYATIATYDGSTVKLYRAIMHDEDIYPNPYIFDPSRYLGANPQPDPFQYVFGFGRRVCPG